MRNHHVTGFEGARILVTGGTGSVGRALVERLALSGAREIRVIARQVPRVGFEGSQSCEVRFIAADVAAPEEVAPLVVGADVIFHLAAMKDVSNCEENPIEAVRTNVVGSANVITAALREPSVQRLVATSSDKACAPTSVLGMTKALMERMVSRAAREGLGAFGCVRLGNIWGGSGSVLARWRESSAREGRIDVTDPAMTRFLLMPFEAVDLLLTVSSQPFAGDVVAPQMRAYQLGDLAEAFRGEHNVVARIVGRRRGEKLHEDLVSEDEAVKAHQEGSLYILGGEVIDKPVAPFNSAHANRLSVDELRQLVRPT